MTRTIAFLFLLIGCGVNAQQDVQRIVDLPRKQIEKLTPEAAKNTVLIPADFAEAQLAHRSSAPQSLTIEKVYYFYTRYRKNADFDQKKLDAERIERLGQLFPSVLTDRYVQWELIEQTGCSNATDGNSYFHGFALVYRTEPSEKERNEEIARLEAFFTNPSGGFRAPDQDAIAESIEHNEPDQPSQESAEAQFPDGNFALYQYFKNTIPGGGQMALNQDDLWVEFDLPLDEKGQPGAPKFKSQQPDYIEQTVRDVISTMPSWNPATENGKTIPSQTELKLRMSFSPIVRGMYYRDGKKPEFKESEARAVLDKTQQEQQDEEKEEFVSRIENSSVHRGMAAVVPREKVAVVMDVTTSMSKHIAGFSWWLTNSPDSLNVVHYAFFNDGDNAEDRRKKVGETGGIYHGKRQIEMTQILMAAMRNGSGGDLPENDLEALLEAQQQAPEATSLLLIVDNFSDVRDIRLLPSITKRTHVLIAGEVTAVRASYLDIAKATGGDIIVNGERISLENVRSGGQIRIAESAYRYDGEHFRIL